MKYFKTRYRHYNSNHIEEIEADRESDSSIWINGERRAKRTEHDNYFRTYQEAKDWLIEEATKEIRTHESRLTNANNLRSEYFKL